MQEEITDPFTDSLRYGVENFLNDKNVKWLNRYTLKIPIASEPSEPIQNPLLVKSVSVADLEERLTKGSLIESSKNQRAMKLTVEAMKRQLFSPAPYKLSKWTRFRLHFAKSHFCKDTEGDITAITEMKVLRGKIYITHTWLYKDGMLIREEQL